MDYLVIPADGDGCIKIAAVEGVVDGPCISWPELTAVVDRRPTPIERATALLLLAPVYGDAAGASSEAVARLADALRTVGVTGDVAAIAETIVSAAPAGWERTADGTTVCDDEGSTRNPHGRAALKPEDLRTVSDLFAARPTAHS